MIPVLEGSIVGPHKRVHEDQLVMLNVVYDSGFHPEYGRNCAGFDHDPLVADRA